MLTPRVQECYMIFFFLCWGLTSLSTIFQSCRDGAIASWVINQYFRGVKCLAQGHNTAEVGLEPRTSRSGVRHSTTEPPRSPATWYWSREKLMRQFPNRVKIIHYEDFIDTIELAKYLYDFLGIAFIEKYRQFANTSDTISATRRTDGYHKFSYWDTHSWKTVQIIDSVCNDLYKESGYKVFLLKKTWGTVTYQP